MRSEKIFTITINSALSLFLVLSAACSETNTELLLERASEARAAGQENTAMIHLKNLLQKDPNHVAARIQLGEVLLEIEDPAAAEVQFERALELGASIEDLRVPLARAMLRQGKFTQVIDDLDASRARNNDERVQMLLSLGIAHRELGSLSDARAAFNEALTVDPDFVEARTELARLLIIVSEPEEADRQIARVLDYDPEHVPALLLKGGSEIIAQRYADAEVTIGSVLELESGRKRQYSYRMALSQLVVAQLARNELEEALASVESLLAIDGGIYPRFLQARVAAQMGQIGEATSHLLDILRVAPDYRPAELLLGSMYALSGDLRQAGMYLKRAVNRDLSDDFARLRLAEVRLRQDNPEEALTILGPALDAEGNERAVVLALAGQASLQAGDSESALNYFQQSVAVDRDNLQTRVRAASAFLSAGEQEQAIILLEDIPESLENNVAAQYLMVQAHVQNQDFDQAISLSRSIVQEQPEAAWPRNLLGTVSLAAGDRGAARSAFEEAFRLDSSDVTALLYLSRIELAENRLVEAKRQLQRVLDVDEFNLQAMVDLARLELIEGGDRAQAKEWIARARKAHPGAVEPIQLLLAVLIDEERTEATLPVAEELVRIAPNLPDSHNRMGVAQLNNGQTNRAVISFRKAIRLDPEQPVVYLNLARAQTALSDTGAALKSLLSAQGLDPDIVPPFDVLASLAIEPHHHRAAERLLTQFRRDSFEYYFLEGVLRMSQGLVVEAADAYDRAFALTPSLAVAMRSFAARSKAGRRDPTFALKTWVGDHPDDLSGQFALGVAVEQSGDRRAAIDQYEAILDVYPEDAAVLNNLAWLYYEQNDPRALQVAQRAYESSPGSPAILDTLGWINVELGDLDRGLALLASACCDSSTDPEIRFHLAAAYAKSGDTLRAQRILEELIRSGEKFDSAGKAQALLAQLTAK